MPGFMISHLKILVKDIRYHLVYTIFLLAASFFLTSAFLPQIMKTQKEIVTTTQTVVTTKIPSSEVAYTERGSPLDNRSYGGSVGTDVIFHGPRDQRRIALTFDAEMTDFMKSQILSGRTKSSYDKSIIDILRKTNTKATLFLTGMWIELYPQVTREL